MAKDPEGGTPATALMARHGVSFALRAYDHDPRATSYGLEAADALSVEPERVYKTLLVASATGMAVGVVPVARSLDLKAMASALGVKKVVMAEPAMAERSSGMVVGGISPLGQKRRLPTVLDDSMQAHPSVLVSGGRRGLEVELAPIDLATLTNAQFAPISRA